MADITANELQRLFPNASASCRKKNRALAEGPSAPKPEPAQGNPLAGKARRKAKGCDGDITRYRIIFRVRSRRPMDWDNISVKELQDCCVEAHLLPDDNWQILEGSVISEKARTREEEGTEIIIERIP